jgi:hypothetical protein
VSERTPDDLPSEPRAESLGAVIFSRAGYALAGLLLLGLVLANFNPTFGFFHESRGADAKLWPWEVFRDGDGLVLRWVPAHVWLLAFTFSGLALLAASSLPAGRLRGGLALTAFALVATALIGNPATMVIGAGANVALALAAGAALCGGLDAPGAARRMLVAAGLALLVFLLLPIADTRENPGSEPLPYMSIGRGILQHVLAAFSSEPPQLLDPTGNVALPTTFWESFLGSLQAYAWMLGCLGAALVLWTPTRLAGRLLLVGALLVAVLGPPAWVAHDRISAAAEVARGSTTPDLTAKQIVAAGGRGAAESLLLVLRSVLLPLALAVLDLLRPRRA